MKKIVVALTVVVIASIAQAKNPHEDFIGSYEGTQTCLQCHEREAKQFVHTVHYLWKGSAKNVPNMNGGMAGKALNTNDFCTYPMISFIGILKNSKGKVLAQGCSTCHAGLGKKPVEQETAEELNNIDCLICHAPNYKRHVEKIGPKKFVWKPNATGEALTKIAQQVQIPTRQMCLRCHIKAGGGPNFKRGDIEPAHRNPPRDFDIHMSAQGANMQCVDCHRGPKHRFTGGGADNPVVDVADKPLTCEACHTPMPHKSPLLNKHARTVACETCHIPTFAKKSPTDMHRDWSKIEYHKDKDMYHPAIKFGKNVKPVYAWWNGKSFYQPMDKPIKLEKDGSFVLSKPLGSIKDPKAKIYPFKYHTARLPYDPQSMRMIPIKVGIIFKTGNVKKAVEAGAKAVLGHEVKDFKFATSKRWMGIYHEVAPKEEALQCKDCHTDKGGRLNWKELGYPGDPMKTAKDRFKLFNLGK